MFLDSNGYIDKSYTIGNFKIINFGNELPTKKFKSPDRDI